MSGIFGMLRFDGGEASLRDVERAGNALAHRGPDGRRAVTEGAIGLGHCLMRVNREDVYEAQPLRDREAHLTLVADLRLDNREELASVLGIDAQHLPSVPDSALVMRAYRKWGADCAAQLLGDFAFAVWDGRAHTLVLARDHMGQRQIHFHHGTAFFAFATDLKALWTFRDVPRVLAEAQIGRMLLGSRTSPPGQTAFEGIHGLPGATVMTVGADGSVATRRYWEPRADPAHHGRDERYYVDAYRRVLGEAVACRIRRTVRSPGITFSGGYDSAAIAGLAGLDLAGSGRKLIAAASVMPADYRGTIRHARPWVEMCARDMPHLDVRYVTREGLSVLPALEQAFVEGDGPAGPYHFVMTELLSTLASAGAQVIMDGHGGDATLHPRGNTALAWFLTRFRLHRFLLELRAYQRLSGQSFGTTLRRDVGALLLPEWLRTSWKAIRRSPPAMNLRAINPRFAERLVASGEIAADTPARPALDVRPHMIAVARRASAGAAPALAGMAARHGLELTRPFRDKRVVELALAIPQDLHVKNGRNRYLACAALRDIYPHEFQTRSRKNDDEIPDFLQMVKAIEPHLVADIARMERSESLARYVDFQNVRSLLAARGPGDHNSGWEPETHTAMLGFVVARYVEWFNRDNR